MAVAAVDAKAMVLLVVPAVVAADMSQQLEGLELLVKETLGGLAVEAGAVVAAALAQAEALLLALVEAEMAGMVSLTAIAERQHITAVAVADARQVLAV